MPIEVRIVRTYRKRIPVVRKPAAWQAYIYD